MILVSILLAFSIEAWWQRSRERAEVREYLTALRSEFRDGRVQLDSVSLKNRRSIEATLVIVALSPEDTRSIGADSAMSLFMGMMDSATFDPSLGVLTALQSAGVLDDIHNFALRSALGGWPGLVLDSQEDAYPVFETALGTVERWSTINLGVAMLRLSEGIDGPQGAAAFLEALASDDEARNRLATRSAFNGVYQRELNGLAGQIDRILDLIDAELGN